MIYRLTTIICLLASTASAQLGHPSLVGHWRFETQYADGELTKTPDSSGNGNHGTLVGSPTLVTGKVGRGYDFVGASSQYIDTGSEFPEAGGLFAASDRRWTVAVWAKVELGDEGYVLSRRGDTTRTFHILFFRSANHHATPSIALAGIGTNTELQHDDGEWHHYAVTWDGTTAKLYSDGTFYMNLGVGTEDEDTGQRVIIGARTNGTGDHLNGTIDEPRIYNRALSANEVRQLYYGLPLEMR